MSATAVVPGAEVYVCRSPDGVACLGLVLVIEDDVVHLVIAGDERVAGCQAVLRTGGGTTWVRFVAVDMHHVGLTSTLDAEALGQAIRLDSSLTHHEQLRKYHGEAGGSSSEMETQRPGPAPAKGALAPPGCRKGLCRGQA